MRTRHFAVLALLCAALLGGCAQGGSGSAGASGGASSPAAPVSPVPSGSAEPSSPAAGTAMVLTGQVQAGVEPGCLILKDAGQTYELTGGDPAIVKPGARVRITGHVVDNVMSHCMQGKPFQVVEAHGL
jgi:hypothetical protein